MTSPDRDRELVSRGQGAVQRAAIHGHARMVNGKKWRSKVCHAWHDMKQRCYNPKNRQFKNYGARGIRVCDRWRLSFASFLADLGEPPGPGRRWSLDRIDNDGNYEPGNCRWATAAEQRHNQRARPRRGLNDQALAVILFFGRRPWGQRRTWTLAAIYGVSFHYISQLRTDHRSAALARPPAEAER